MPRDVYVWGYPLPLFILYPQFIASGAIESYKERERMSANSDNVPSGQNLARDWERVGVCQVYQFGNLCCPIAERRSNRDCPHRLSSTDL